MTQRELLTLLKNRLDAVGHGIDFDIVEDGVRTEGGWWYVPVIATRNGQDVPREFTINLYANVEDDFEQEHRVSLLIVPVVNEAVGK